VRKTEAEIAIMMTEAGITSQQEERQRLADSPDSNYSSLDVEELPDLLDEEKAGLAVKGKFNPEDEEPEADDEIDDEENPLLSNPPKKE
jgi:uncharacterized protein